MSTIQPLPLTQDIETTAVLKKLAKAHQALAELKGVVASIPNQSILISTLSLQEAKDSSEIENIITTHDDLYRSDSVARIFVTAAAKEVHNYATALREGFEQVKRTGLLTNNLFRHPYTKIEFVMDELQVTRKTAAKYLDEVVRVGLLSKHKLGKDNYYLNDTLYALLQNVNAKSEA